MAQSPEATALAAGWGSSLVIQAQATESSAVVRALRASKNLGIAIADEALLKNDIRTSLVAIDEHAELKCH